MRTRSPRRSRIGVRRRTLAVAKPQMNAHVAGEVQLDRATAAVDAVSRAEVGGGRARVGRVSASPAPARRSVGCFMTFATAGPIARSAGRERQRFAVRRRPYMVRLRRERPFARRAPAHRHAHVDHAHRPRSHRRDLGRHPVPRCDVLRAYPVRSSVCAKIVYARSPAGCTTRSYGSRPSRCEARRPSRRDVVAAALHDRRGGFAWDAGRRCLIAEFARAAGRACRDRPVQFASGAPVQQVGTRLPDTSSTSVGLMFTVPHPALRERGAEARRRTSRTKCHRCACSTSRPFEVAEERLRVPVRPVGGKSTCSRSETIGSPWPSMMSGPYRPVCSWKRVEWYPARAVLEDRNS